jgi:hypothetical protein
MFRRDNFDSAMSIPRTTKRTAFQANGNQKAHVVSNSSGIDPPWARQSKRQCMESEKEAAASQTQLVVKGDCSYYINLPSGFSTSVEAAATDKSQTPSVPEKLVNSVHQPNPFPVDIQQLLRQCNTSAKKHSRPYETPNLPCELPNLPSIMDKLTCLKSIAAQAEAYGITASTPQVPPLNPMTRNPMMFATFLS